MTGPLCRSAVEWARVGARAASISSVTTYRSSCERSCPPYFLGQVMPIQPLAPTLRLNSRENDPLPSPGTKVPASASWCRNARTSCRNSLASGGSSIGSKRKLKFIGISVGSRHPRAGGVLGRARELFDGFPLSRERRQVIAHHEP